MDHAVSGSWANRTGIFRKPAGRLAPRCIESETEMSVLLEIDGLNIEFPTRRGTVEAAKNVSLTVKVG